ncbi:hypothetical protein Hanom_Chr05g00467391 [Helianthus anomalus]
MNFDLIFLHNTCTAQERRHVLALIALKLDHFTKLFILHNSATTAEFFLEIFENFLVTELLFQTLNCCQAFSTISLLYADMNILFHSSTTARILFNVSKWIESRWDLNFYINHELRLN